MYPISLTNLNKYEIKECCYCLAYIFETYGDGLGIEKDVKLLAKQYFEKHREEFMSENPNAIHLISSFADELMSTYKIKAQSNKCKTISDIFNQVTNELGKKFPQKAPITQKLYRCLSERLEDIENKSTKTYKNDLFDVSQFEDSKIKLIAYINENNISQEQATVFATTLKNHHNANLIKLSNTRESILRDYAKICLNLSSTRFALSNMQQAAI